VAAGEGDSDGSTTNDLGGRWEGVRRSGCRMKQRWRCLTMDEVDGGFTGAALKTNTSAIDGDLRGEQSSNAAVSCGRRHRKRGGMTTYRGGWRRLRTTRVGMATTLKACGTRANRRVAHQVGDAT
jgi:hypothetical protein